MLDHHTVNMIHSTNDNAIAYDNTGIHCGQSFTRQYNMLLHKCWKHPEHLKTQEFKTLCLLANSEQDKTGTSSVHDGKSESSSVHDDKS